MSVPIASGWVQCSLMHLARRVLFYSCVKGRTIACVYPLLMYHQNDLLLRNSFAQSSAAAARCQNPISVQMIYFNYREGLQHGKLWRFLQYFGRSWQLPRKPPDFKQRSPSCSREHLLLTLHKAYVCSTANRTWMVATLPHVFLPLLSHVLKPFSIQNCRLAM